MNLAHWRHPRQLWLFAGAGLVVLGIIGGHWEVVGAWSIGAVLCFASAVGLWLDRSDAPWIGRAAARLAALNERRLLGIGLALWCAGWAVFFGIQDPNWVPSGIDWHDSYLDAYALRFDDPPLYCAWRYPFYPALSASVTQITGVDLSMSTQFVSRCMAVALVIPLYVIGRSLYGRAAAVSGIVLMLCLATFRMHTDAVTPYPTVMFLSALGAAGIVCAARGGLVPFLVIGASTAGLLATDGKSLLVSLGFVGLAIPMAIGIPWRWTPGADSDTAAPRWTRGRRGGALLRSARLLLLILPIVTSYRWMGSLPVKAFTLEEMAVAYLLPGGRGATQAPRNLQDGYMWGHFTDAWTIPRTLQTFWEAGRDPALAQQNAHQWTTSIQRLRLDYPGFTQRVPIVLGLCLLVPLLGRRKTKMRRLQAALQVGGVAVVLASCWPSIKSDYQERYIVHGTVLLPLLLMGGLDGVARLLTDQARPLLRGIRGLAVVFIAGFLLFWTGNPVSLGTLEDRLDPVAMGGLQEYEVGEWGRENLESGDLLVDSSWMMQALLLAGEHTVARTENSYPPGGAPWPAGAWRFTRPFPTDASPPTRFFALVNFLAMAPDTHRAEHVPIESLIRKPDSPMGRRIIAQSRWTEVFHTSDTIVRIYRWDGPSQPPRWQLHRRSL